MTLPPVASHRGVVRQATSLGFVVLHAAAAAFAVFTLTRPALFRELLALGVGTTNYNVVRALVPYAASVILLLLVAGLALVESRKAARRWRRAEAEPDVCLRLRVLFYAAAACAMLSAFVWSTPETYVGPFRLRYPILGSVTAAGAYGLFALWYALLPRLRRWIPAAGRRGLDLVAMNACLTLLLAEGSLRVLARAGASSLLVTESVPLQVRRDAHRQAPGTRWFGFPMNRGGHYDTEFVPSSDVPGPLVVSIGDSFSYGAVPHAYHFTTVAEDERPGVEIYNMGYSAIGPSDYLHLLQQEALPLKPDLVVVHLFVGNDITDGRTPAGPPRWYDGDSYLLAVVWHRLRNMKRSGFANVGQGALPSDATREALVAAFPFLADPLLEPPSVSAEVFRDLARTNAERVCLAQETDTQRLAYEGFFQTLEEIVQAAGDTPLGFVLIPEEFQVEDDVWDLVVRSGSPLLDRDLPQRKIGAWLEARGVPVLDLLPILRDVAPLEDGRRHLYHLHDLHFNARGNAVAGRALARFLGPLPPARLPLRLTFANGTIPRTMRSGWIRGGPAGDEPLVWSDGLESLMTIALPARRDIQMDIEVSPFVFPDSPEQRVTILLDGITLGDHVLRPGRHRYSVTLPGSLLTGSTSTLAFRYAYAQAPRDVRPDALGVPLLAIGWHALHFAERLP